jgi:hypothetical protein
MPQIFKIIFGIYFYLRVFYNILGPSKIFVDSDTDYKEINRTQVQEHAYFRT